MATVSAKPNVSYKPPISSTTSNCSSQISTNTTQSPISIVSSLISILNDYYLSIKNSQPSTLNNLANNFCSSTSTNNGTSFSLYLSLVLEKLRSYAAKETINKQNKDTKEVKDCRNSKDDSSKGDKLSKMNSSSSVGGDEKFSESLIKGNESINGNTGVRSFVSRDFGTQIEISNKLKLSSSNINLTNEIHTKSSQSVVDNSNTTNLFQSLGTFTKPIKFPENSIVESLSPILKACEPKIKNIQGQNTQISEQNLITFNKKTPSTQNLLTESHNDKVTKPNTDTILKNKNFDISNRKIMGEEEVYGFSLINQSNNKELLSLQKKSVSCVGVVSCFSQHLDKLDSERKLNSQGLEEKVDLSRLRNMCEGEVVLEALAKQSLFFLQWAELLNYFTIEDVNGLVELIVLCSNKLFNKNTTFDFMLLRIANEFTMKLLTNFDGLKREAIVYSITEMIMSLCQNKSFYSEILTLKFFEKIYYLSTCEKFSQANEMFHLLYYMLESQKTDKKIFRNFFIENSDSIINLMQETLLYYISFGETYIVERDSLFFFKKIILNPNFTEIRKKFLNNPYNLKIVLLELNNKCHKIRIEALALLHEFFVEMENLEVIIQTLVLDNKENFYLMFEFNNEVFDSIDATEKKNFILCELERIDL